MTAPLCDGGRCSQVMAAFAKVRDGFVERQSERLTEIIREVLAAEGITLAEDRVRERVAAAIEAMLGSEQL